MWSWRLYRHSRSGGGGMNGGEHGGGGGDMLAGMSTDGPTGADIVKSNCVIALSMLAC